MTTTADDMYVTDDAHGDNWHLMLGDSCERLAEIADDSVGLSMYSPPFDSLYTYSPSPRDLGNSNNRAEFLEHYGYIIRENLRVTDAGPQRLRPRRRGRHHQSHPRLHGH